MCVCRLLALSNGVAVEASAVLLCQTELFWDPEQVPEKIKQNNISNTHDPATLRHGVARRGVWPQPYNPSPACTAAPRPTRTRHAFFSLGE